MLKVFLHIFLIANLLLPLAQPRASANPVLTPGVWTNIAPAAAQVEEEHGQTNFFPQGVTMDPSHPNILYWCICGYSTSGFGALPGSIWKTTDAGSTWFQIKQLDQPIHVRVDPHNYDHLYAVDGVRGNTLGFWISQDGGKTWTQPPGYIALCKTLSQQGISNFQDAYAVSTDPGNFKHVLVSSHSASTVIGESVDGGITWTSHAIPGVHETDGTAIFFLSSNVKKYGNAQTWLFCTQQSGMFRTTDSGNTWTKVTNAVMSHGGEQIYYTEKNVLFVGANGNPAGPIRSTDNGLTWQTPISGLHNWDRCIGIVGDGVRLYISLWWENSTILTSSETDGLNWTPYPQDSRVFTNAGSFEMAYDATNGIIYSSNTDNGGNNSQGSNGLWAMKVASR